jgi:formate-dependent nitrite reductase membrane component NrfD
MQTPYGREQLRQQPASREDGPRAGDIRARQPYGGEDYYGMPAVKGSTYGWLIVVYFFVGGIAAGAQFIATVVDIFGSWEDRLVVRVGRYLAFAGSLLSPALLIADLHAPRRWYNMLRIFRTRSPMSIGAWTLTAFGMLSGLTAAAQLVADKWHSGTARMAARTSGVLAAMAAAVVALYTGTLLSATSTPLWMKAHPFLSSWFASSAAATAEASLSLAAEVGGAPQSTKRRLERFGLVASAAELLFGLIIDRRWRRSGVATPLQKGPLALLYWVGAVGLGVVAPLGSQLFQRTRGRRSRRLTIARAVAKLAGGLMLRAVLIYGGNRSAARPADYFRISQPGER